MKLAVVGSHGVGKTTLSYAIAASKRFRYTNVKLLGETARECPFPLNKDLTFEAVIWIYHRQMIKELEASAKYDNVICDRSVIDSFMYGNLLNLSHIQQNRMLQAFVSAKDWMGTYDEIIYIKNSGIDLVSDGVRDTDKVFQEKIETYFDNYLAESKYAYRVRTFESKEIFKKLELNRWN